MKNTLMLLARSSCPHYVVIKFLLNGNYWLTNHLISYGLYLANASSIASILAYDDHSHVFLHMVSELCIHYGPHNMD